MSRPISRVLSWTTIHLGPASPQASSSLPESTVGHSAGFLFGLAPGGVYHATSCCQSRGALLPHHFNLTGNLRYLGGVFSVALSVGSHLPGVTWRLALRSPDFPLNRKLKSDRLADSTVRITSSSPFSKRFYTPRSSGKSKPY
ncbi:Uncharacterised protein [Zhongshania aliphaticivorans]|uniref:Uncharacterized protein n=1 Tax=Zhongshania aliphaticivorans TaxID=1470434 RepID=A0A5S9N303_9GAMM|nr:Uncharacterised protein [Zhongshania aliphaticivorans]CAA0083562.1 Uncharacterised protein [Zhongshania aliphaticivorans]